MTEPTTLERLTAAFSNLSPAERTLTAHLRRNHPVAGLASITALAKAAGVSTPTVVRLVQKVGFKGYPDFQAALRDEVEAALLSPLAKHDRWAAGAPQTHILNRFADAVLGNLQATLAQIDPAEFDAAAALLADPARQVYAVGGRITHATADYLVTHLSLIRRGVTLIPDAATAWPPAMLDLKKGDVLVAFDIRRYENAVLNLVELAAGEGAEVVLVTDQWVSPAATHARHRFAAHVEAPSAWDSTSVVTVLVETLLAAVQALTPEATVERMTRLEGLLAKSRLFRRGR
ncbi:MurR/RpiR family transcriptional regulator [Frigidibacter sp. ROC022]|uniref:MurR/RpiR family transcriptional regulator n=1 Tax=Frigidibacter sp. ROC022 TaxID=2971796 RepID=UPI00215B391F|nr:MurR/RpiR family transcriptional regulator [Frigidibacter sp. ROC022]MCR8725101.1 MurR/RpiR family transcriptional regulator [Frigidibacter sp. ROC022]